LYYVMYNVSKPSTECTYNAGVVSYGRYFPQRRENIDPTDKIIDEEPAKQTVDVYCKPADSGIVCMNRPVSASVSDAADINSNIGVLTAAKADCFSELCSVTASEEFGTEETDDDIISDVRARLSECGAVELADDAGMLNSVAFTIETPTSAAVDAGDDCADDGDRSAVGLAANGDAGKSLFHVDIVPQNNVAVTPELSGEEKIGFEPEAITAADQWPQDHLPAVERRVKHLQKEVRLLLFDENGSGVKRELRTSGRVLGGVRRKTRRSPLMRLRTVVSSTSTSRRRLKRVEHQT